MADEGANKHPDRDAHNTIEKAAIKRGIFPRNPILKQVFSANIDAYSPAISSRRQGPQFAGKQPLPLKWFSPHIVVGLWLKLHGHQKELADEADRIDDISLF